MKKQLRFVHNVKTGVASVATKQILHYLHKKNLKDLRLMPEGWRPGDSIELEQAAPADLSPQVLQAIAANIAKAMPGADEATIRMAVADATGQTPPPADDKVELSTDPNVLQEVVAAIGELDNGNPEHYTNGGKPDAKVLSRMLERNVSAAERDEAFEVFDAPVVE